MDIIITSSIALFVGLVLGLFAGRSGRKERDDKIKELEDRLEQYEILLHDY